MLIIDFTKKKLKLLPSLFYKTCKALFTGNKNAKMLLIEIERINM